MLSMISSAFAKRTDDTWTQRQAVLSDVAEQYLETVVGVRSRFLVGRALPPADFINTELERRGVNWRVRNVAGERCEFLEI
jgi:hypothetical protein